MAGLEVFKVASQKAVGTKQTIKAVLAGSVKKVYIAQDAENTLVKDLQDVCAARKVPVEHVESMADLGRACGVNVRTASAAILVD